MEADHPAETHDQFGKGLQEESIMKDSRAIFGEPMPLMQSGKYSLVPDVKSGWKPNDKKVEQEASPTRREKLNDPRKVGNKKKKLSPRTTRTRDPEPPETTYSPDNQPIITVSLNTTRAEIRIPEQRPHSKLTYTDEKKEASIAEEQSPATEQREPGNLPVDLQRDTEIVIIKAPINPAESPTKAIQSESESTPSPDEPTHIPDKPEDPPDQDQQEEVLVQSLAAQEPEPDPESPPSSRQEERIDIKSERTTSEMMLADAEALPFMDENFSIFNSQKELQKVVKQVTIDTKSEAKFTLQTPKIPLIENTLEQQLSESYLENGAYEVVYNRARFRNSQELLYHNLKLKPDPLYPTLLPDASKSPIERQLAALYGDNNGVLTPAMSGQLLHQPQQPTDHPIDCLTFDSEYEGGNLETALYSGSADPDGHGRVERYKLLVQNDYNTNGHQQWFNFTVSDIQVDTVYELQIGPLKKRSSKFSEGMLPWVSQLTSGEQDKNIAHRVVSNVQYATKKNGGMSFLTFRLVLRSKDGFSRNERLQIAYSQPYTYTRLLNLLTEVVESKRPPWLSLKVGKLGNSLGGLAIPLVIFGAKSAEAILSAYQKPVIVLSARVHPGEPPASFLVEGFIRAMISPANAGMVQKLLTIAEVHVVPMHNPDGVIIGNSRVGLGGVDMNRRWGSGVLNPTVTPEVGALKSYLKKFQNQVLMFLDLHGHTKGEGIFFYSCDPGPPQIEKLVLPRKDAQAQSHLEKWILVRAMPRLACLHSKFFNKDYNRFYTLVEDLAGKKENTARATCFNELGIDLSYTIESSFHGFPDKSKSQFGLSPLDRAALLEAGDDLLKIIHKITFLTQKLEAGNQVLSKALSASTIRLSSNTEPRTQSLLGAASKTATKQSTMSTAILEQLRPIYRGVEAQIIRRRARLQMISSSKNQGGAIGKDLWPRHPSTYKFKSPIRTRSQVPQGLIQTIQCAMQRRKIELDNRMSPTHTFAEIPSQQRPTEQSQEERQVMQATYVGSEWTYDDTGGNLTQYQLLQNESFQVLDQSKPVSCSESEQDEREREEERPPIFESLQSDCESHSSQRRSSDRCESSSDSSGDNMEPFILDELEGVIALEKGKQVRTMQKREREWMKQMRRQESQLRKFEPLAKRNSQVFGSSSKTQIDPAVMDARANSQLVESHTQAAMLLQQGKTVTNQFRPHNILGAGHAIKKGNLKVVTSPKRRQNNQESQAKLSQTQRLSINARSLSQMEPPKIPNNAKKHFGHFSTKVRSIQPSSTRLHKPFETGPTTPLLEQSLITLSPSQSPAEASRFFMSLAEQKTSAFNSLGMYTIQDDLAFSKKRSLQPTKSKQRGTLAKLSSRLEQIARTQQVELSRFDKRRSQSQLNQITKPIKSFRAQKQPLQWRDGIVKVFEMDKTVRQENSKSNLSQNSQTQLVSRKASISSFKPAPSQKALQELSLKKTQQPLMKKILRQNPFVKQTGISVRMQDVQGTKAFSPFNFQQELISFPQDSPGRHRPLLPSRFSQTTVLGKAGDSFPQAFTFRQEKVEKVPTQLDVKLNPLQSNTAVSFFNTAGTKFPPPETAYNQEVDAYREHLGTQNLKIAQQSSGGPQDQNSVRTMERPSRSKASRPQDSIEEQIYEIRRNPNNSVLPQIYKK